MSSPAYKRQRLSSPTYDAGLDDLSTDDLKELDRIELTLSQLQRQQPIVSSSSPKMPRPTQATSPKSKQRRMKAIMAALQKSDDKCGSVISDSASDNPFEGFKSAGGIAHPSNQTSDKHDSVRSSSPDNFQMELHIKQHGLATMADTSLPMFQAASKSLLNLSSDEAFGPGANSESQDISSFGFATASNIQEKALKPSKAALARAKNVHKDWSTEDEDWVKKAVSSQAPPKRGFQNAEALRPPLAPVLNSPSVHPMRSPQPRSFSTPLLNRTGAHRPKGFKSPFLSRVPSTASNPTKDGKQTQQGMRAQSMEEPVTPGRHPRAISDTSLSFTTPVRPIVRDGCSSVSRPPKLAFSTPFKKGMKPGEPGRATLEDVQQAKKKDTASQAQTSFTLRSRPRKNGKIALQDSGLRPQQYSAAELESMGVNIAELSQITPQTAPFYVFYSSPDNAPPSQLPSSAVSLGPGEAFAQLRRTDRNVTKEWVDNHWALVLWKLAGLAALDPLREATPTRRWCWNAVLEQLKARHDKEFGKGLRPALRLITTGDAPAGSPLVLVVTAILSTEEQRLGENGKVMQDANAEIEVSDGWYRLRALLDAPLARAVIRGIIRPGRKIAVSGAKLENERKDPCEVLEAYNSCTLLLSGNGSHLAPWHANLGSHAEPFVATLGSLTPDGGRIPLMDFIVEKVHPIAYIEFLPGDKPGEKKREGPRGEAEEATIEDAWRKQREAEESKVREELNTRWSRWDGFADRLERAAGSKFSLSAEDMPPDHIEDLFDELDALPSTEVSSFICQLGTDECGWLARYLRRRSERDREHAAEEIELEINHICPPREVRNFRIVQVRDARTSRRPANRIAHLCIWDVLSLCVSEGVKEGSIEPGQRFLMTNLMPMQQSCWMGHGKDDMVYLSTTRNSRFY